MCKSRDEACPATGVGRQARPVCKSKRHPVKSSENLYNFPEKISPKKSENIENCAKNKVGITETAHKKTQKGRNPCQNHIKYPQRGHFISVLIAKTCAT
jgi:hypothetical protein